ncbi:MAG TPA: response regulator transcription factor [Caldisericia bacterium]|nr:response regulator transcription factor [Caldisericia bacterium]HPF48372.1 response regulator transcription factor [Caldisericia bacterium]HPI83449.1 response regulator transcription factor [Caldisericia bacterium]HPQ92826.1 response regulator transcription factor [Caldisericia bacterium]HRV74077.1 response regulator transcription factor [Caldisericia bacterium]
MNKPSEKNRKKILIIEDEYRIVETLRFNLEAEGYIVYSASTGEEGLALKKRRKPDLIVLDLMLPRLGGTEVIRNIRAEDETTPIIVLTAKTGVIDSVLHFELGANDFVTKPYSIDDLKARIKARLREASKRDKSEDKQPVEEIQVKDLQMNYSQRTCIVAGKSVNLGYKEFEILWFLASSPDRVFTREQIMERVWGVEQPLDTKTVDVHIRWIRKKIEPAPENPKYIETVRGVGYKFSTVSKESDN